MFPIDSNGNLTTKTEGSDSWGYEWNARNELTRVTKNSVEQARFAYDPKGRRVEKVAGGLTTTYTYDSEDILREVRGGSTLKYVHGRAIDEPLAMDDGTAWSYFHADGLGSILKTTNAAGAITFTRRYDAWGNLEVGASEPGYAFTGREWDPESGLYYYRARYYDPGRGRFVGEDPIKLSGGLNLYGYVANSPQDFIDPDGKKAQSPMSWCVFRPWACGKAMACAAETQFMVYMSSPGPDFDQDNSPENAAKHCVWACCVAQKTSRGTAIQITDNYEYENMRKHPCATDMDIFNNMQGITFGSANPKADCSDLCSRAPLRCAPKSGYCVVPNL